MALTGLRIKTGNSSYNKILKKIWDFATDLNPVGDSKYKDGIEHCKRVSVNLERLMANEIGGKYSIEERFLLSAAASIHDIYKGSCHCMRDHGAVAAVKISELEYLCSGSILKLIGHIISIHDQGSIRGIPNTSTSIDGQCIFLPRLALLFKLADMLDCTYKRINTIRLTSGIETS
ncbi:MAG: HD domain-containing protein, partial [Patescibacteria group bacterium]